MVCPCAPHTFLFMLLLLLIACLHTWEETPVYALPSLCLCSCGCYLCVCPSVPSCIPAVPTYCPCPCPISYWMGGWMPAVAVRPTPAPVIFSPPHSVTSPFLYPTFPAIFIGVPFPFPPSSPYPFTPSFPPPHPAALLFACACPTYTYLIVPWFLVPYPTLTFAAVPHPVCLFYPA